MNFLIEWEDAVAEGVEDETVADVAEAIVEDAVDTTVWKVAGFVEKSLSCFEVPNANAVDIDFVIIDNEYIS